MKDSLSIVHDRLEEFPLDALRGGHCVYFLLRSEEVVYVGKTVSLAARLLAHRQDKDFDRVRFLPIPNPELCTRLETEFIRTLRPVYNFSDNLADIVPSYRRPLAELLELAQTQEFADAPSA